jgi:hypothetical protein
MKYCPILLQWSNCPFLGFARIYDPVVASQQPSR